MYHLFGGNDFYPQGGVKDFVGTFENYQEACVEALKLIGKNIEEDCMEAGSYTWFQVSNESLELLYDISEGESIEGFFP